MKAGHAVVAGLSLCVLVTEWSLLIALSVLYVICVTSALPPWSLCVDWALACALSVGTNLSPPPAYAACVASQGDDTAADTGTTKGWA